MVRYFSSIFLFVAFGVIAIFFLIPILSDSSSQITTINTGQELPKEKQIICWQGIPYKSYFGLEVELTMSDNIPELYGTQVLVFNQTGLCKYD